MLDRRVDHFRKLVDEMTSPEGWQSIVAHMRASVAEGMCPVCASPLKPTPHADEHCEYGGNGCTHGYCLPCRMTSHSNPGSADNTVPDRETIAIMKAGFERLISDIERGQA
jgi:hypothetical protein